MFYKSRLVYKKCTSAQAKYTNEMQVFKDFGCALFRPLRSVMLLRGKDCLKVEQGHGEQVEIQSLEQEGTALTVMFCPRFQEQSDGLLVPRNFR